MGEGLVDAVRGVCNGARRKPDIVVFLDGRHLDREWGEVRQRIEESGRRAEGRVDWHSFDEATVIWYAQRLEPTSTDAPAVIRERLLDGRTRGLDLGELHQLTLLFGRAKAVRALLGRDVYDLRAVGKHGVRWEERLSGAVNLLSVLRESVSFFARHVGIGAELAEDLSGTQGSADYIAMREALVNQLIHQDYADRTAAAQVELASNQALFFNTGYSLVTEDQLADGGKSQARNPLIARALRLVGYAELAGSGLRALQYEWRQARRRPPVVVSDRVGNSFSLTLDWREVPDAYDTVWKEKLGVRLSETQATVLNLATDPGGITAHQVAAGTGCTLAEARESLRFLVHQVLLAEHDGRFHLQPHLREALQ